MANNYSQPNPPGLTDLLDAHKRDVQLSINCVQIGIIQSFNAAKQTANIQLSMKQVSVVAPDGTRTIQNYPILIQCPVMTLFGGVAFMSMPILPGDNCIVLFNDRELDNWLNAGDGQTPTTPRLHDLSDGIAIVGIRPLTKSIASYLTNGIRLSYDNNSSKIDLKESLIDTIAALFLHHGNMEIAGNLQVDGNITIEGTTFGNGSNDWNLNANLRQAGGFSIHAGNGVTGTFDIVQVVDGIVIGGS